MGSVLEERREKANWLPLECSKSLDWSKIWFDLQGIALRFRCWREIMRLKLHPNGTTQNPPGISIRPLEDRIRAVSCYNPANTFTCDATAYMKGFFEFMTDTVDSRIIDENHFPCEMCTKQNLTLTANGTRHILRRGRYKPGHSLDAMPYDFRRTPLDMRTLMFPELKARVERMYAENQNRSVTLVAHSLGGVHTVLFLNTFVDEVWKDKYIARLISIAGAYGGSVKAIRGALVGENDGWPAPFWVTQPVLESWISMYTAFPCHNERCQVWGNRSLVHVGDQEYSAANLTQLLRDFKLDTIANTYKHLNTEVDSQSPPNVTVHCVISTGWNTIQKFFYR